MKKIILFLFSIILSANITFASHCFVTKEKSQILKSEGNCTKRYPPMSSFKIPLSLIGFDSGVLIDEMHPVWSFKEGYDDFRDAWKQDQTPKSWIKESCVWYSQVLTKQLGMKIFKIMSQNLITEIVTFEAIKEKTRVLQMLGYPVLLKYRAWSKSLF